MTDRVDLKSLLVGVVDLAKKVGAYQVAEQFMGNLAIDAKSSGVDLVTRVDQKCEHMLKEGLIGLLPDSGFLGEETGLHDVSAKWRWVVDPLDGTTNYAQGLPMFAISIALEHQGQAVLACVYIPRLEECFTALKDQGAWLNGQPLVLGDKHSLNQAVIGTGFPYDRASHPQNNAKEVMTLVPLVRGIRRMGAAAVDMAYVAAGRLDGYWEYNLSPWDMAAGHLLITSVGGSVKRLDARGVSLVAGNQDIVAHLIKALDLKLEV